MDRYKADEEVWMSKQALESTCVGVLLSTNYKSG